MTEQASSSFELLNPRIQRWIWSEGWTELRDAQEAAIPAIIGRQKDVIIAAATAAGKTEAAFFPVLTHMLREESDPGLTVYISPLKALINDQFGRLESLCESLEIPVFPWHGDISSSVKSKFLKTPAGILLITPESLEAMLCNKGFAIPNLFARLRYFVIDELHSFIGSERGKQLQSLMQRIDVAIGQKPVRIGLSATLGDMRMAANFLRPGQGSLVNIIESKSDGGELKILIKGYIDQEPSEEATEGEVDSERSITQHLYKTLRGSNNLVFPNSRKMVERYTYALRKMCEQAHVPNEFWPHHGSLSREIREETEAALKAKDRSTTAICTNTLELGIDIGAVKSIAQIGSPPSVASLRQRLGRSGRRKGEPAILRGYAIEFELNAKSHLMNQLREGLFEQGAMVGLLLEGWFEPPRANGLHLSTLVQQLLSLIAQRGGVSAADAYRILCETGPFNNVSKPSYVELLRHLGQKQLIQQDSSGVLLHGKIGEPIVNHYSFYAAFASEEEFRVLSGSQTLGTLPISSAVSVGDFILFAAQTWRIEEVDEEGKAIYVTRHVTGKVPPFNSRGGRIHGCVRQRMKELYTSEMPIPYFDETASKLAVEGRRTFQRFDLDRRIFVSLGSSLLVFTWLGDDANEALAEMLKKNGYSLFAYGPAIEIHGKDVDVTVVSNYFKDIASQPLPTAVELLSHSFNLAQEKWDWALPETLLKQSFASLRLDIQTAHKWLVENFSSL
jgi:ATP-dependent Lhr-like helicase